MTEFKMPKLGALLPEIKAAQDKYDKAIAATRSGLDVARAADRFNKIIAKAIDAVCEDTKDVNSPSTLRQVFAPRTQDDVWFVASGNVYRYLHGCALTGSFSAAYHRSLENSC